MKGHIPTRMILGGYRAIERDSRLNQCYICREWSLEKNRKLGRIEEIRNKGLSVPFPEDML